MITNSNLCPLCGKNIDMVGRSHLCTPRPEARQRAGERAVAKSHPDQVPAIDEARKARIEKKRGQFEDVRRDTMKAVEAIRAKKRPLPQPHPGCERCAEQTRRAVDAMRARRAK